MRIGTEWIPYEGPEHFNLLNMEPLCNAFAEKLENVYQKRFAKPVPVEEVFPNGTASGVMLEHPRLWITAKQAETLAKEFGSSSPDRLSWKLGRTFGYSGIRKSQRKYGAKCSVTIPAPAKSYFRRLPSGKIGVQPDPVRFRVSHIYYHISQLWNVPQSVLELAYQTAADKDVQNVALSDATASQTTSISDRLREMIEWTGETEEDIEERIYLEKLYKKGEIQ